MSTPSNLSTEHQEWVKGIDASIRSILSFKEKCEIYKLGDVCVTRHDNGYVEKNSTGEPMKYQVVHISPLGIPYLQRLTATGKTSGDLYLPPEIDHIRSLHTSSYKPTWQFVQDPAQLDAIMLQQEYAPMKEHKEKLRLQSEINKHNKAITIPTGYFDKAIFFQFLKGLKPGDKFWMGIDKQFVVHQSAFLKHKNQWTITVINPDQQQKELSLESFSDKRLYKAQPRSYSKEVDK